MMTPMLLVMAAIGGTDILFALDSIPAIFGLTQNVFIVFTATAFSLLGLRQLYFLIDGLLDRLIYLTYGLAAILAFIGVKLILHALHENNVPFINDGEHVNVVEISTGLSLVGHHRRPRDHRRRLAASARRAGRRTPSPTRAGTPRSTSTRTSRPTPRCARRSTTSSSARRRRMRGLPEKYRARIREEDKLMRLLQQAHAEHDAFLQQTPADVASLEPARPEPVEGLSGAFAYAGAVSR